MKTIHKKLSWDDIDRYLAKRYLPAQWVIDFFRSEDLSPDVLSKCQMVSKFECVDLLLGKCVSVDNTVIVGAWYGQLAQLLNQNKISKKYVGIDIDPEVQYHACHLNRHIEYSHAARDMYDEDYSNYDLVINTSCEHIKDTAFWLSQIPSDKYVLLSSNNYSELEEHVNCSSSLGDFELSLNGMVEVIASSVIDLPMYERYIILGKTC